MKLILIGYGKMSNAVELAARNAGHHIGKIILRGEIESVKKSDGDIAVEFTSPRSAYNNIKHCIEIGMPVISGTTGWLDKKDEIDELCKKMEGTFFYASNFSIGVNLFFRINRFVASLMKDQSYSASITEIHHTEKLDEPSGTAISLANDIMKNNSWYKQWKLNSKSAHTIPIESIREGKVPGTHKVNYASEWDCIQLYHEAFGREGFAQGVIKVAEWLGDKKGVLGMDDFLKI